MAPGAVFAQDKPRSSTGETARRIDVHHHFVPPVYVEKAGAQLLRFADADPQALLHWAPGPALDTMDRNGVTCAMLSTPPIWFGDQAATRALARGSNEYAARLIADHSGRFGLFAAVPMPNVDDTLAEIAYALDTLKADGIFLTTSYDGKLPGDPVFSPVMEELNRRKAVLFIHPGSPACCANTIPGVPSPIVEFLFDSTRALLSLMVSGTLTRCPDIRCIFTHTGGVSSVLATRITEYIHRHPDLEARLGAPPMEIFRRQHYDIANSVNPATMAAAIDFAGGDALLFGSDLPFVPMPVTAKAFDDFGLPEVQKQAINRGNAIKLFPRLA